MTMTYVERFAALVGDVESEIKRRKWNEAARYSFYGTQYDVADRAERMILINRIADDYVKEHAEVNQAALDRWEAGGFRGERPASLTVDTTLLERLTDAVLNEELSDTHPDKVTREEYPFFSAHQLKLRHDRETSLKAAEETGTDGRDYRVPKRRRRSGYENNFVDANAKIRNLERAAQYKRDTAAGALVTYNLRDNGGEVTEPFVASVGIGEAWRDRLNSVC